MRVSSRVHFCKRWSPGIAAWESREFHQGRSLIFGLGGGRSVSGGGGGERGTKISPYSILYNTLRKKSNFLSQGGERYAPEFNNNRRPPTDRSAPDLSEPLEYRILAHGRRAFIFGLSSLASALAISAACIGRRVEVKAILIDGVGRPESLRRLRVDP